MNNFVRLLLVLIYPIIIALCFLIIIRRSEYKRSFLNNIKQIIANTLIISIVISLVILVYFKSENTIYSYDYAGHWIRSLTLRKMFFNNPEDILSTVYNSMNYNDYSFLPALFGLPITIINTSYGFFCLGSFIYFIVPSIIALQILYFSKTNNNKWLPIIIFLVFYPLYFCIFQGEIDGIGLFFLVTVYMLIVFPDFRNISVLDNIFVNLCIFISIFLRRWYLYTTVAFYLAYFIKYLSFYRLKVFDKQALKDFGKIVLSGLLLLIIVLLFFRPFLLNAIGNNYAESYAYYNNGNKLLSFINFYSLIIVVISICGFVVILKKNKALLSLLMIMTIVPTIMFWFIQSFEYHHYYMITLNVLIAFAYGTNYIFNSNSKVLKVISSLLLTVQVICIFTFNHSLPILTSLRKIPVIRDDKNEIMEISYYLRSIETENWQSAYMPSGSSYINDDIIRNSILPDLDSPRIDSAVLDIRDGFPKDFEYITYFILTDPIQYLDEDYQHMYKVINDFVRMNGNKFSLLEEKELSEGITIQIYERIGEITTNDKELLYNQMISYYPNKKDFFSYILD